jgi:hypothetical protein
MRRALFCLFLLIPSACAIAFSPGLKPAPPPTKFQDIDNSSSREEEKKDWAASRPPSPAFGISFVVGGTTMDAGSLPPPPVPVVLLP